MKTIPLQQIRPKLMTRTVRTSARPEEVYALFKDVPYSALLNSSLKGDASRFSYIAIDPFLTITSRGKKTRVRSNGRSLTLEEDPFTVISRVLAAYRGKIRPSGPFTAGGIGYFSYDLKNILEDLPRNAVDDLRLPETVFSLHKTLMTFDERSPGKIKISCLVLGEDTEEKVKKHLSSLAGLVSSARNIPASHPPR
ncbi:MAG: hypothetical protein PHW14_07175 [Candidatus Omnitrophica bacterium]|nr:hypothetical protein [Candidatus Omnitrophota bacterium]